MSKPAEDSDLEEGEIIVKQVISDSDSSSDSSELSRPQPQQKRKQKPKPNYKPYYQEEDNKPQAYRPRDSKNYSNGSGQGEMRHSHPSQNQPQQKRPYYSFETTPQPSVNPQFQGANNPQLPQTNFQNFPQPQQSYHIHPVPQHFQPHQHPIQQQQQQHQQQQPPLQFTPYPNFNNQVPLLQNVQNIPQQMPQMGPNFNIPQNNGPFVFQTQFNQPPHPQQMFPPLNQQMNQQQQRVFMQGPPPQNFPQFNPQQQQQQQVQVQQHMPMSMPIHSQPPFQTQFQPTSFNQINQLPPNQFLPGQVVITQPPRDLVLDNKSNQGYNIPPQLQLNKQPEQKDSKISPISSPGKDDEEVLEIEAPPENEQNRKMQIEKPSPPVETYKPRLSNNIPVLSFVVDTAPIAEVVKTGEGQDAGKKLQQGKDQESQERQYRIMGFDRAFRTKGVNLVEKLQKFLIEDENAREIKKAEEAAKAREKEEKENEEGAKEQEEDDEFNFDSRYFMYNPTQVCFRCRKPGHVEKWCTEDEAIKCLFCLGPHKMAECIQIVCFNCNGTGHKNKDCPYREKMTCFRCGKKGHKNTRCGVLFPMEKDVLRKEKRDYNISTRCLVCDSLGHPICGTSKSKKFKGICFDDLYMEEVGSAEEKKNQKKERKEEGSEDSFEEELTKKVKIDPQSLQKKQSTEK